MPLLRGMKTALNLWYGPAAQALVLACLGLAVLLLLNFSYGAAAAAMLVPPLLLASAPGGGASGLGVALLAVREAIVQAR